MIFVENFVNTSDQVIVVAMITGAVSITGVVISSIVAKIVEYKYNVKKYLYDKREEPYKQFVEMNYKIMEDSPKKDGEKMTGRNDQNGFGIFYRSYFMVIKQSCEKMAEI